MCKSGLERLDELLDDDFKAGALARRTRRHRNYRSRENSSTLVHPRGPRLSRGQPRLRPGSPSIDSRCKHGRQGVNEQPERAARPRTEQIESRRRGCTGIGGRHERPVKEQPPPRGGGGSVVFQALFTGGHL